MTEWIRDRDTVKACMGDINAQVNLWVRGGSVLDLGGRAGWFLKDVEADRKVVIDLEIDQLARSSIDAVYGDILDLPFADRSFDHVVARGVLHHVPDRLGRALDEAWRVLADGGILFVQDPGGLNPPAYVARKIFPTTIHVPDERPFDPRHLRSEIAARFAIVDEGYFHLTGYMLPHIVPRMGPLGRALGARAPLVREIEDAALKHSALLRRLAGYVQFVGVKNPSVPGSSGGD